MKNSFDRRYEVFIGSPFTDLREIRQELLLTVLRAGHFPCGTELWAASPEPTTDVIKSYLDRCDIHVLVVGFRYGSMVNEENASGLIAREISYTEWEFDRSVEARRPVLVFLLDEKTAKEKRSVLTDDDPEHKSDANYWKFRVKLKLHRLIVHFDINECTAPRLALQCLFALQRLIDHGGAQLRPEQGWIRAGSEDGRNLQAIHESNILHRVIEHIGRFNVLAKRMNEQADAKRTMARHFWDQMQGRIREWCRSKSRDMDTKTPLHRHSMQVFFESGSTLIFLAQRFEAQLLHESGIQENWRIRTNNILCLLLFDLFTPNDAHCFPNGKPDPEDRYGAIFPGAWSVLERPPHRDPTPPSKSEKEAIRSTRQALNDDGQPRTFILATASGWDVERTPKEYRGPHVGSYKNKIFKRVLFESGNPVVVFMDAAKFGQSHGQDCYAVFGPGAPVATWLNEFPIAICIGWEGAKTSINLSGGDGDQDQLKPTRFVQAQKDAMPSSLQMSEHLLWIRERIKTDKLGFDTQYFFREEKSPLTGLWMGAFLLGNKLFSQQVPTT